ncbi:hypothetical protein ACW7BJ_32585 [Azospirillum argentinense]
MSKRFMWYVVTTVGLTVLFTVFVPFADLKKLATVVMAFFGALTGFLVNLMMRTAQALEGQGLKASELRELSGLLREQQLGWRRLFYMYVGVVLMLVVMTLLPDVLRFTVAEAKVDISPLGSGVFVFALSIALLRSLTMLSGIEALQELRARLLIEAAERKEKEAREKAVAEVVYRPGPVNPNYGRTIPFPGTGS